MRAPCQPHGLVRHAREHDEGVQPKARGGAHVTESRPHALAYT